MFDAVIFDLDGTLIDTEALMQAAGIEAFAEFGIVVDPAILLGLIGKDDLTSARILHAAYPGMDETAFAASWQAAVYRQQARGVPFKPGALEVLGLIRQPKALATSSTRPQADRKLAITGLGVHFAHVVTFNDVARAKPAPDPFLLAARLLGVDPARCLAFEDSDPGAEAAHSAGMTVVQVPDIVPTEGRFAHLVAPDLITGARLIGLLQD